MGVKIYRHFPARYHSLVASDPGSLLLQTSRFDDDNHRSYLFTKPVRTLVANAVLFSDIEEALGSGAYVAGFFTYECGEHLARTQPCQFQLSNPALARFGVYYKPFIFDHKTGEFEGDAPEGFPSSVAEPCQDFEIRNLRFDIDEEHYGRKVATIQEYIRAGDTYQVNFTHRAQFDFSGSPEAMFAGVLENQSAQYCAFFHGHNRYILSLSPELFFRLRGRRIVVRPMKGTARRGTDTAEDETIARWLQNDQKNRSENVMIVDLLRNDLGRICEYGSVQVDQLFAVEKYETLFQMTSEISGVLREGVNYSDILGSLFPSGSVTGAPKHRTMEIIRELENGPRGIYTGAIGFFSPEGEAVFSVPIRTVVLENNRGVMGVGSGIVIDSRAEDEFHECWLKTQFLRRRESSFQLIESILWNDMFSLLELHLQRMESSAAYFGFIFDRNTILAALEDAAGQLPPGLPTKVRILLERSGEFKVSHTPVDERAGTGKIMVSPIRVSSSDRFLRHKTTNRQLYDEQYECALQQACDDVLFLNERDEVTEGAVSNVFVVKHGQWLTPPVTSGVLPGTYRAHLLQTKSGSGERVLKLEDLAFADEIYICNAVRGCKKVTLRAEALDDRDHLEGTSRAQVAHRAPHEST
jgi:para-aminobenzoate synthetase/4-amino-4-deoxychorismate lyase